MNPKSEPASAEAKSHLLSLIPALDWLRGDVGALVAPALKSGLLLLSNLDPIPVL